MATAGSKPELVVIVGPTASGKSDLAIRIAKQFDCEIISADSLTIYKAMDIGTAKPTILEQQQVPHWGFDIAGPGQGFSAAKFKEYTAEKIEDIRKRGKIPIIAGGTGLYVDSLVYDFEFGGILKPKERTKLEKLTTDQLQAKIKHMGFKMPQNAKNKRHLVRTIERKGQIGAKKAVLPKNILMVGILPDTEVLKQRIHRRVGQMFKDGLVEETKQVVTRYGEASVLVKAKVAYGPVISYLNGEVSLEEAKQKLETAHWQFARRQRTWFKRNPDIQWFSSTDLANEHISSILNN